MTKTSHFRAAARSAVTWVSLLFAAMQPLSGVAQDPAAEPASEQPAGLAHAVTVLPSGDEAVDELLRAASGLIRLRARAPTDASGLQARMLAEPDRLRLAFESEGYWAGRATVALRGAPDGAPPPTIAEVEAAPRPVNIELRPRLGPRYTIRSVVTDGADPIALAAGQPARADTVLAVQSQAQAGYRAAGYPLARIERQVTVDHAARAMDVRFLVARGPLASAVVATIEGSVGVRPEIAQRVAATRLAANPYSPELIAQTRSDLLALGPYGSIRVEEGTALDADGRFPVTFRVQDRPFRALTGSAGYETNFGATVGLGWEHRNLLGGAERLTIEAEARRLGSAFDRTNARLTGTFRLPIPFDYDGALVSRLSFNRDRLDAFDRDAVEASILYEWRLSRRWTASAGPTAEIGRTGPSEGELRPSNLVGFAMNARYDSTDSPLDPRRGIRLNLNVTPSYSISRSEAYMPTRATGSTYIDLSGNGRSVLAFRASLGSLLGADAPNVPPAQRLYAGGGGSVRGFTYQSIGPRDARDRPAGGASLLEGSVEFRQRFGASLGGVVFVDTGAVGTDAFAPTDSLRVGAGVGVRYYTAFGPVRADVAVPLVRQPGSSGYGLYIGIGHAF
ncbi:autotransporter assembly complex protein TamA [Plastoroseomonas arctica]|uniref:BamA/TamA family outer membrane protein n=1 Tax=Plastoroseomonas arctica TaxID=1509237 RepID=A0AAF1JZY0_9PROT|nr:BamA/TamA family outer membrane protein [Plastoroseomonas arctica]MBR0654648.1 BamA/TamA family outer membrane protein [Plastoroseomonas arctica]